MLTRIEWLRGAAIGFVGLAALGCSSGDEAADEGSDQTVSGSQGTPGEPGVSQPGGGANPETGDGTGDGDAPVGDDDTDGGSPPPVSQDGHLEDWQKAALDAHNAARDLHCVPALTWNQEAASFAQDWAEGLCPTQSLLHSSGSGFGENLYLSGSSSPEVDLVGGAMGAVNAWYGEIDLYDFNNPGFSGGTGHFTQVVWRGSTSVGCGIATCNSGGFNTTVVSCNYAPAGNFLGQFEQNVPERCR